MWTNRLYTSQFGRADNGSLVCWWLASLKAYPPWRKGGGTSSQRDEGRDMKLEKRERWLDLPPSNHLAAALKEQFHTGPT